MSEPQPEFVSPETPIVPTSGTKRVPDVTNPAVVQDAQLVRMSVLGCEGCPHSSTCGVFNIRGGDDWPCIAALDRLEAERDALLAERTLVDIVFDGPPSHESGRFVDVENMSGASVGIGEWIDRGDGYWALRIPTTTPRG